nr:MAG TPA: nucelotide kinase [Caudoviricetes sp.]
MSKCNKCKYEYSSKLDEPCKYCRERMGGVSLAYQMSEDKFEPKKEQPTTEYKGCDGCYYEWLGESDAPCCECKHRFEPGTMARLKAKDCFKPKEEIANDEIDMVNHPQHYQHGIEPIEYIESHDLNFNLGNVIKYVSRAPFKGTELQDLKKAKWYLEREIKKYDK